MDAWSEARALIARTLDRGFKFRLRHGCLSLSFYVVLSCVGRGLVMS
jgi:predicted amidohydrolase